MEKKQRGALRTAVVKARGLLESECQDQLEGSYNILPDGKILANAPGDPIVRAHLLEVIAHHQASGDSAQEAVARTVREAAFTILNRFAALKMAECRGIVRECISQGPQSVGIRELADCAPGLGAALDDGGYRLLLEALMDEVSIDLKMLLDRRSPMAPLWPSPKALEGLLEILNTPEFESLWADDETIGWVYQYFNADDVKAMRRASQAPRNSRELAVRNQFFTPRYVVRFLTDNTLGAMWLEMMQGDSVLAQRCEYVVPMSGGWAPRPKKDPRDIRVLDPACGSGHFLLYAFDLLEAIYKEAWHDADPATLEASGNTIRDDYPKLADLRSEIPKLILRNNLFGVEIDPRAAQTAGLSLWLRAQRSFERAQIAIAHRPPIDRVNIAVAEAMPGEPDLRKEFIASVEPRALGQLVEVAFEKMDLAGVVGTLLPIEEEIRGAVAAARKQWEEQPTQLELIADVWRRPAEQGTLFDVAEIKDELFWVDAEQRIYSALRNYASSAEDGQRFRRRLFADDAAAGIAFINICRHRFDVTLMNPPFGDATPQGKLVIGEDLKEAGNDIGCAFVTNAHRRSTPLGMVGFLLSTAPWFKPSFGDWRNEELLGDDWGVRTGAHLGGGVLDGATVSASAVVLGPREGTSPATYFRHIRDEDKEVSLDYAIRWIDTSTAVFRVSAVDLRSYRGAPLTYWISRELRKVLASLPKVEGNAAEVRQGVATADDGRFVRAWWEVPSGDLGLGNRWAPFAKSSEYSPYWDDITWVVDWGGDGGAIRTFDRARPQNLEYFGQAGVTYPARSVLGFNPRAHPADSGFGHMGSVAFPVAMPADALLGYLSSRPLEYVLSFSVGALQGEAGMHPNHYEVGLVQSLPAPVLSDAQARKLGVLAREAVAACMSLQDEDDTSHQYLGREAIGAFDSISDLTAASQKVRATAIERAKTARGEIDTIVEETLGFREQDVLDMQEEFSLCDQPKSGPWSPEFLKGVTAEFKSDEASALLGEFLGVCFGRVDIRVPLGAIARREQAAPFAPLPACPPGLLDPEQIPRDCPIDIPTDGILVDDPGSDSSGPADRDLLRRIRVVLDLIWGDRAHAIEDEFCEIFGTSDLRSYLRKPTGFFQAHHGRFSKSRRRAPIYWPLAVPSGRYTIWAYYPRLSNDLLYRAMSDHVQPKIAQLDQRVAQLEAQSRESKGRSAAQHSVEMAQLVSLADELREMQAEFTRITALPYHPSLHDGVPVSAAPLWQFFRLTKWRNELEKTWKALESGKLDWSALAIAIWPERVRKKYATDKSLAISHGLESSRADR